jgi:hypothetical protein
VAALERCVNLLNSRTALPEKGMYSIQDCAHLIRAIAVICRNGTPTWFTLEQRLRVYYNIKNKAKELDVVLPSEFKQKCLNRIYDEEPHPFVFR